VTVSVSPDSVTSPVLSSPVKLYVSPSVENVETRRSSVPVLKEVAEGESERDAVFVGSESVKAEPSEILTIMLPVLIVILVEYDVVPCVITGITTVEDEVNGIVLRDSGLVGVERLETVTVEGPDVVGSGNVDVELSEVLTTPLVRKVEKLVSMEIVPSEGTSVTI